jgi:hypothetical protein
MKASAWLFSAAMSVSCLALAQTAPKSTVTESTDPAKAAEIEHHAQELQARAQEKEERAHMKKQAHPSKSKPKQKPAKKEKAPSDTPMDTTEGKG